MFVFDNNDKDALVLRITVYKDTITVFSHHFDDLHFSAYKPLPGVQTSSLHRDEPGHDQRHTPDEDIDIDHIHLQHSRDITPDDLNHLLEHFSLLSSQDYLDQCLKQASARIETMIMFGMLTGDRRLIVAAMMDDMQTQCRSIAGPVLPRASLTQCMQSYRGYVAMNAAPVVAVAARSQTLLMLRRHQEQQDSKSEEQDDAAKCSPVAAAKSKSPVPKPRNQFQ